MAVVFRRGRAPHGLAEPKASHAKKLIGSTGLVIVRFGAICTKSNLGYLYSYKVLIICNSWKEAHDNAV